MRLRPATLPVCRLLRGVRFVSLRGGIVLAGADRSEAKLRDPQRECSLIVVTAPGRQVALCWNFFNQVLTQQFAEHLLSRAAFELGANFNGAVLTLRGGR